MEIQEMIEVLQAFKNGEEIEYLSYDEIKKSHWVKASKPSWDFFETIYRIKPKPEYIPFDYNDDLVGKIIKSNKSYKVVNHSKLLIVKQMNDGIIAGDYIISYQDLLDYYIFLDGSKCGKLKS